MPTPTPVQANKCNSYMIGISIVILRIWIVFRVFLLQKIKDNSLYYFYFLIFLEYEANVGNQYCTLQKYVTHYNSEAEIHLVKMVCK